MDIELLENIGLTKGETRVYLTLLELGQTTTGPIVEKSKVSTSKIYSILKRLMEKGLVSYILKKKVKYFKASPPEKIIDFIERRQQTLDKKKKQVLNILPSLKKIQELATIDQEAEIYEGFEGLRTAFDDIINTLNKDDVQYVFGAGIGENDETYTRFFHLFHKRRERKGIKAKIIFNEDVRGKFKSQEDSKLVETRYLFETTPAAINIYADNVIIALLTKKPIIFLMKSKEITNSFKEYFNVMWRLAKK